MDTEQKYWQHILAAELNGRPHEARLYRALIAHRRRDMPNIEATYKKALAALADEVIPAGRALIDLRQAADKYPLAYVQSETQRLMRMAAGGDAAAVNLAENYQAEALAEARKLRTQAEVDRDPAERSAEIAERAALLASSQDGADLAAQAAAMLDAERPQRAAFLLSVAREKGGASMTLGPLAGKVGDALDAADPARKEARALEQQVETNIARFLDARMRTLIAAGIGVSTDGSAGRGRDEDITRANVARKMAAFESGGDFSDGASDGGAS